MSNEELVSRIQAGETELFPELWNCTRRFIYQQALRYLRSCPGRAELDDLVQSAYFAVLDAAENYRADGGGSFLSYLVFFLKREFFTCMGFRSGKHDPLNAFPLSLDAPIAEDEGAATLGDMIPDPSDTIGTVERKIYLEQLRSALDAALDQLPADQREVIVARYYKKLTIDAIATEAGESKSAIVSKERKGLEQIRKRNREIERFIDERTNFYKPVELAVMDREKLREQIVGGHL